jgi:hypothetical protein
VRATFAWLLRNPLERVDVWCPVASPGPLALERVDVWRPLASPERVDVWRPAPVRYFTESMRSAPGVLLRSVFWAISLSRARECSAGSLLASISITLHPHWSASSRRSSKLETREVGGLLGEVRVDADSMQAHGAASNIQHSHVLDGRILDDLNGTARQGFDFFHSSLRGGVQVHLAIILGAQGFSQTGQ